MYDTIVLQSPEITKTVLEKLVSVSQCFSGYDMMKDDVIYKFTTAKLDGSFDYRISIKVKEEKFENINGIPEKVSTPPYIEVECSIHKLLMNHNVYGGPEEIQKSAAYLIKFIEDQLNIELPDYKEWYLRKIDVTNVYELPTPKQAINVIRNIKKTHYTRRNPVLHPTSITFPGTLTTLKVYYKGTEFKKHDYKRTVKYLKKEIDKLQAKGDYYDKDIYLLNQKIKEYDRILEHAKKIVRFEVSIKEKLLEQYYGKNGNKIKCIDDETLKNIQKAEIEKLVKESGDDNMLRKNDEVLNYLIEKMGTNLGNSIYTTWCKLAQGKDPKEIIETSTKTTFYRHRKILKECNISWNNSDLKIIDINYMVPIDFSFVNSNYQLTIISNEVQEKLNKISA